MVTIQHLLTMKKMLMQLMRMVPKAVGAWAPSSPGKSSEGVNLR